MVGGRAAGLAALRERGVRGWAANTAIWTDEETRYVGDVVFRALRLVIEIDGWEFHRDRSAFQRDRLRDADLARAGWQVVRFPASWVLARSDRFAAQVDAIVRERARQAAWA